MVALDYLVPGEEQQQQSETLQQFTALHSLPLHHFTAGLHPLPLESVAHTSRGEEGRGEMRCETRPGDSFSGYEVGAETDLQDYLMEWADVADLTF
jgi:hypothetical protein